MPKVEIYTTMFCPYCVAAKRLLTQKGVAFEEVDVTMNRGKRGAMAERAGGRTSVPQIFFGSTHIGGCDDLYALESAGKLDEMLAA